MASGSPNLQPSPEALLSSILEATGDAVVSFDAAGTILSWNRAAEELLGYAAEDVIGKPAAAVMPEGHAEKFLEAVERVLGDGPIRDFRTVRRREDGTVVPLDVLLGVLRGEDGSPAGVTMVCRDASDREAALGALRDSNERYRILFNQGDDAVFVLKAGGEAGLPGRFIEINDVACLRYGYTREELLRMTPGDLDAPEMADRIPLAMERLTRDGQALFETLHVAKGGGRIPVEINAIVFAMDGEPAIFSICRDLSRRNEYEEALRRSEARFRSIIDSSPMGIHLYRLEGEGRLVFTGSNPASDAILGTACGELVGRTIEEAFPGLVGTDIPGAYREVVRTGNLWSTETFTYRDDRIHGAFEVVAFQTSPETMAAMFTDVTKRRQLEQETMEAKDRLIAQMKAHESYVSEVAHRLRNPLQILTGYLSVFPGEDSLSPEQWVALETLKTAVQRIEEDIKGLTP